MDIHILINISGDTENHYGVDFFTSFFSTCQNIRVTLFHIRQLQQAQPARKLLESWEKEGGQAEDPASFSPRQALERAHRMLLSESPCKGHLQIKTIREQYGTAKDILQESSQGLYDAMILGRRATYALQGLFSRPGDAIAQSIASDSSLACPLWLCHEPEKGRKNILLCLDGSASSYRAADHVGFILTTATQHNVTMFHASNSPSKRISEIFTEGKRILTSHGIEENRISATRNGGLSVPGTILAEAETKGYAAVAVGLHGISNGRILETLGLQNRLTVSLLKKLSKASLWCIP